MILITQLSVPIKNKKKNNKFGLNLNEYRNLYFRQLNEAKVNFSKIMSCQVVQLPKMDRIELVYTVFFPNRVNRDVNNYCSVIDKFLCDCLVKAGKIPDDNYKHLQKTTFIFGGIDKENPRCEIKVLDLSDINSK